MKNLFNGIKKIFFGFLLLMGSFIIAMEIFKLVIGLFMCGPFMVVGGSGTGPSDIYVSCTRIGDTDIVTEIIIGAILFIPGFLGLKKDIIDFINKKSNK